MRRNNSYKNLLVGNKKIDSRIEYKYALLRGQLAILLAIICFIYIPIDLINNVQTFIPAYIVGIFFASLIIYFNRRHHYFASTITLLLFSNILVYIFAAVDNPASGVFFFFTATAAMGLILFYPFNKLYGYVFILLSMVLALIAYHWDWSPLPPPLQTDYHISINFTVNIIMGMMATILIVVFIMRRNEESEKTLIESQEAMHNLTGELQKSKVRFQLAVEGSKAGIYEWNLQSNTLYVSPQWLNLLGYHQSEAENVNVEFFMSRIHPEDAKETSKSIETALKSGTSYQNELRIKCKDEQWKWFQDSGIVQMEHGSPTYAVGSIIDIEDRKLAEVELLEKNEQLGKINEELDRFVYSASHDMRAPLSTLLGLLQLAKMTNDPKELESYFEMMTNRIYTMEGFIKEVTDYSRNARLKIEKENFKLVDVVNDVIESFQFLAEEANVKIETEIDDSLSFNSDKIRLKVILNNLLSNGIKYHDPNKNPSYVKVQASTQGNAVIIRVNDNGVGIRQEYLENIFDMFFRASESSSGSGLGLYIVRETLERLDGSIFCTSNRETGTTFEVHLPVIS